MTSHLHAHISTTATDCDGRMDYDYVVSLNETEIAEHQKAGGVNDFHDLSFKGRVLQHVATFCPYDTQTITIDNDGFEAQESTDEGHRHSQVQWCEDPDCDPNEHSQRDYSAEAMGY